MGEAFLVRRGGSGGKKTETPTITYVSRESTKLTFKIKNNDANPVFLYWEEGNDKPNANRIELAGGATSDNITLSGLTKGTEYTIYTWAIAILAEKVLSKVGTMTHETLWLPDKKTLAATSWEDINTVSEAGEGANYWNIGDKKAITVNGITYQAQIIAFNHDNLTNGGKAGITFQLENCLSTTYKMNNTNTNVGGWNGCLMRTSTMATLYNQLSADLKAVIKPVDKLTSKGNKSTTKETASDKLFLLSEIEVFGSITNSVSGEGSQYAFYKSGNSKIKKVGTSANGWWGRSPSASNTDAFYYVSSAGDTSNSYAMNSDGVAFGFCI